MLRSMFIGLSQSATFRKIALGFPLTRLPNFLRLTDKT